MPERARKRKHHAPDEGIRSDRVRDLGTLDLPRAAAVPWGLPRRRLDTRRPAGRHTSPNRRSLHCATFRRTSPRLRIAGSPMTASRVHYRNTESAERPPPDVRLIPLWRHFSAERALIPNPCFSQRLPVIRRSLIMRVLARALFLALLFGGVGVVFAGHEVQITSSNGGRITVINAPGDAYSGPFSSQDRTYLQTGAQLAGWTSAELAALNSFLQQADSCVYTLFVEANPKDPERPQYRCEGAADNCTAPCSGMVNGGTQSLTLILN